MFNSLKALFIEHMGEPLRHKEQSIGNTHTLSNLFSNSLHSSSSLNNITIV